MTGYADGYKGRTPQSLDEQYEQRYAEGQIDALLEDYPGLGEYYASLAEAE